MKQTDYEKTTICVVLANCHIILFAVKQFDPFGTYVKIRVYVYMYMYIRLYNLLNDNVKVMF